MGHFIYVGLGGFLGSMLRYGTTMTIQHLFPDSRFPWGTLIVNVVGCLAIGFLGTRLMAEDAPARLFLIVGVLGGFTTFSSLGFETYTLAGDGHQFEAMINLSLQVLLGLAAVWIGALLSRLAV